MANGFKLDKKYMLKANSSYRKYFFKRAVQSYSNMCDVRLMWYLRLRAMLMLSMHLA